jgi:acetolactate synthase small subunit
MRLLKDGIPIKTNKMRVKFILTIKADDRPGLLHLVTGMINRRLIEIESLSAAKTNINNIVLITIELNISENTLTPLRLKLENIIEVYAVEAVKSCETICLRAAWFKMDRAFLETPQRSVLQKHGAAIVNLYPDAVMVAKYGSDLAIQSLYNELAGPHLLGFSQAGLIADSGLIGHEDLERISWLAA